LQFCGLVLGYGPKLAAEFDKNELVMAMRDGRPGADEVRKRVLELCQEIDNLRKLDQEQRLSRESQVPWDAQKQHEARVARMDEIKEELVKLGRGLK
jgi:hypothetical protein